MSEGGDEIEEGCEKERDRAREREPERERERWNNITTSAFSILIVTKEWSGVPSCLGNALKLADCRSMTHSTGSCRVQIKYRSRVTQSLYSSSNQKHPL